MRWTGMMSLVDRPQAPPHLIRIDIDPAEMRRLVPHAGIVADADAGTRALLAAVRRLRGRKGAAKSPPKGRERGACPHRRRQGRGARGDREGAAAAGLPRRHPRGAAARAACFVIEVSQVGFTSYFGYPVYAPRTYVSEGYQGTLGFGFPTALGVKVAHPDKAVVSVTGDGGFLFARAGAGDGGAVRHRPRHAAVQQRLYGNVLRDQRTAFGNRVIGAVLDNPDFMLLAKAFGVEGHRVASPAALEPRAAARRSTPSGRC